MDVVFHDKKLELIETEQAQDTKLPIAVIKSCRQKFVFLRSIADERDLRNWKSLCYEKLQGDRDEQRSIRINKQWRLVFQLDKDVKPTKITILAVENHCE